MIQCNNHDDSKDDICSECQQHAVINNLRNFKPYLSHYEISNYISVTFLKNIKSIKPLKYSVC